MLDPIKLQSIVDGECTHQERREWLAYCESHPEHWRTLALAMIEEQQFSIQLRSNRSPLTNELALPTAGLASSSATAGSMLSAAPTTPHRSVHPGAWFFLAACLVAVAAFFAGKKVQFTTGLPVASQQDSAGPASGLAVNHPAAKPMPEADLRVRLGKEEIPLYESDAISAELELARQAVAVQRINTQLRQQGYEVDLRPRYITGQLHDGSQLIIPVHDVGISSYGQ